MEDGEIFDKDNSEDYTTAYDPALEWPGDKDGYILITENSVEPHASINHASIKSSICRLVVIRRGAAIASKYRVALIDGYPEVQLGRDAPVAGSVKPRIRLKEMEVSKLHATIYWDSRRQEWNIVDMGSKHGTFLRSSLVSGSDHELGTRLSPPRASSIPRLLSHLDILTLGSTSFIVHIHDSLPCMTCSPDSGEEVPLSSKESRKVSHTQQNIDIAVADDIDYATPIKPVDAKTALGNLKRNLIMQHRPSSPISNSGTYVDRSARRRALHPPSRFDSPGIFAPSNDRLEMRTTEQPFPGSSSPVPLRSKSPVPISSSNVGHKLLMKQGWTPGSTLGLLQEPDNNRIYLSEPLIIQSSNNRAGLGTLDTAPAGQLTSGLNWKDIAQRNR